MLAADTPNVKFRSRFAGDDELSVDTPLVVKVLLISSALCERE